MHALAAYLQNKYNQANINSISILEYRGRANVLVSVHMTIQEWQAEIPCSSSLQSSQWHTIQLQGHTSSRYIVPRLPYAIDLSIKSLPTFFFILNVGHCPPITYAVPGCGHHEATAGHRHRC
jgi:hypothetical protein